MNPIIPIPFNDPNKIATIEFIEEPNFEAKASLEEIVTATTNLDPEREIFVQFLNENTQMVEDFLKRVDSKYPELLK